MRPKMSPKPAIRCLVDDTILTRNISEIEPWVSQGALILVVPLYSMAAKPAFTNWQSLTC